ncbi:MAG: Dps family protein [Alphaproteobacteria bacterium]
MSENISIGLEDNQRKQVVDGLSRVLANTFILYTKTHGYHWNVTGPLFHSLHEMFEEQYTDLFEATDELAERIRALGEMAPTGVKSFQSLSELADDDTVPEAVTMVKNLVKDHETVIRHMRTVIAEAADLGDEGTADMLTARMEEHEKAAWMLRSIAA